VNGKPKDFLKEQELIQELCKYIDAFLEKDDDSGKGQNKNSGDAKS
jgi:hypothetical protein